MVNVELVDFFFRLGHAGYGDGFGHDLIIEQVPLGWRDFFTVIEAGTFPIWRQDDGGHHDRSGCRAAASFVDTGHVVQALVIIGRFLGIHLEDPFPLSFFPDFLAHIGSGQFADRHAAIFFHGCQEFLYVIASG